MIKRIYESCSKKLYGCCPLCCTRVECDDEDAPELYVLCPQCKNPKLHVRKLPI